MSLLNILGESVHLILEGNVLDILQSKMNFSENNATKIVDTFGKKHAIFFGNLINALSPYSQIVSNSEMGVLQELHSNLTDPKLPKLSKSEKNDILFSIGQSKSISPLIPYLSKYTLISRFITSNENINFNFFNVELEKAYSEASDWANSGEDYETMLKNRKQYKTIHVFDDGYYWVDLKTKQCDLEQSRMRNCGKTDKGDTLLSLRDQNGVSKVDVAFSYDGTYYQMKGKGNVMPHKKYWEYCMWLFDTELNEGSEYDIRIRGTEHDPNSDFIIQDYMEVDADRVEEILEEKPTLANFGLVILEYRKRGMSDDKIFDFLEENVEDFSSDLRRIGDYVKVESETLDNFMADFIDRMFIVDSWLTSSSINGELSYKKAFEENMNYDVMIAPLLYSISYTFNNEDEFVELLNTKLNENYTSLDDAIESIKEWPFNIGTKYDKSDKYKTLKDTFGNEFKEIAPYVYKQRYEDYLNDLLFENGAGRDVLNVEIGGQIFKLAHISFYHQDIEFVSDMDDLAESILFDKTYRTHTQYAFVIEVKNLLDFFQNNVKNDTDMWGLISEIETPLINALNSATVRYDDYTVFHDDYLYIH